MMNIKNGQILKNSNIILLVIDVNGGNDCTSFYGRVLEGDMFLNQEKYNRSWTKQYNGWNDVSDRPEYMKYLTPLYKVLNE
jgi:hypothetical protein